MPVVFDINETTLDLAPVRRTVDSLVGPEGGFVVWFQKLLQLSMTTTATDRYLDFSQLAASALDAGWTTIALTNSAPDAVTRQLERAGLASLFRHVVSVDKVRTYKPAVAPYRYVADLVDKKPEQLWMVACHDWDLAGARAVGYNTAFIQRPGMSYADCYEPADISVTTFVELAAQLMA